jgi:predicted phosphoribosyltransferase
VKFADRAHAGRALAEEVARLVPPAAPPAPPALVLALPRGGVPVAVPVAERIGAELDILIVRKIGAPGRAELGVGAIAEDGPPVYDAAALRHLRLTEADLAGTVAAERAELRRRIGRYRQGRPAPRLTDRIVVLVDDGLATGVTTHAALRWVRGRRPSRLVVAVPVCSRQARALVSADADLVVCLHEPADFTAVGRWYTDFDQLSDADVDRALAAVPRAD